uniref:Uncharacterized protein n=1 Tax=Plectus sambesii TaxID=2011161 RepID=A0A914WQ80_9BILA
MMETVVPQHQRRVAANSAFFGGGSSDSGGSSTSTSPSPPDHFGNTHGVFAAQQFSPTAIDSAYVSTTSSPSGAGRFNIWATNTAADAAEDKANNGRRHLFAEYDTRHQVPAGSVREKGCPEAVSLSSSTRLKHSSVAFADKPMRNVFIEPNSGMRG